MAIDPYAARIWFILFTQTVVRCLFLQSFDDLVAKGIPKQNMKIKDKDGSDMGESVGPDYVVCIEYKYVGSGYTHEITWY